MRGEDLTLPRPTRPNFGPFPYIPLLRLSLNSTHHIPPTLHTTHNRNSIPSSSRGGSAPRVNDSLNKVPLSQCHPPGVNRSRQETRTRSRPHSHIHPRKLTAPPHQRRRPGLILPPRKAKGTPPATFLRPARPALLPEPHRNPEERVRDVTRGGPLVGVGRAARVRQLDHVGAVHVDVRGPRLLPASDDQRAEQRLETNGKKWNQMLNTKPSFRKRVIGKWGSE